MREVPEGFKPIDRQNVTIGDRPTQMPTLPDGGVLVCEFIRAHGMPFLNMVLICETVEEMQQLFDAYCNGGALQLNWYITIDFTKVLSPEETAELLSGNAQQPSTTD